MVETGGFLWKMRTEVSARITLRYFDVRDNCVDLAG